jgi:hypothetical protein
MPPTLPRQLIDERRWRAMLPLPAALAHHHRHHRRRRRRCRYRKTRRLVDRWRSLLPHWAVVMRAP